MVDFTFMFPFLLLSAYNHSYYRCCIFALIIVAIISGRSNDFKNMSHNFLLKLLLDGGAAA
jgi:hypothetical protein